MKVVHTDIATALKKSRWSVVTYLEELREHQICSIEAPGISMRLGTSRCAIRSGHT